jgi:exosortase/archaeosortase family protein
MAVRGVLEHRSRISRAQLFFGCVLLAALNAFAGVAVTTLAEHGLEYALIELFGISAIIWLALGAALDLLWRDRAQAFPDRGDWAAAAVTTLVALLPSAAASGVGLTLLALLMILTSPAESPVRRAALILLSITVSLVWGRVFLSLFSDPLLDIDSWLVGRLAGTGQTGNIIAFAGRPGEVVIAPGCSSFQSIALALVFWTALNQWLGIGASARSLLWYGLAVAATVAINVLRIGAMVHFPARLEAIHHGYGWHISMWATLAAVCGLCLFGARDAIFRR